MDLLVPTSSTTQCPYKSTARYYGTQADGATRDDVRVVVPAPDAGALKVAGYVCFYDERVDVHLDGALQDRPSTPFG